MLQPGHVIAEPSSELDGTGDTKHTHCHAVLGSLRDERETRRGAQVVGFSRDGALVYRFKCVLILGLPCYGKIWWRDTASTGKLFICFF